MRIINADNYLHLDGCVVALGNFDGVHIAHQKLINKCVEIARKNNLHSVVYTFSKHPKEILGSKVELLTLNAEKEKLFDKMGVDILIYQDPNLEFLDISPEVFVDMIIQKLSPKAIVVGQHYMFGRNAVGDIELLKKIAIKHNVDVCVLSLLEKSGEVVSSSLIREMISNGDIEKANQLLGREFELNGVIKHGKQLGTQMGIPTANFDLQQTKVVPQFGVYACKIAVDGEECNGVANIGLKPTFNGNAPLVEVHLFDKSGDFYGKNASVKLLAFIRNEIKFENVELLKKQILFDVCKVKEYFSFNT